MAKLEVVPVAPIRERVEIAQLQNHLWSVLDELGDGVSAMQVIGILETIKYDIMRNLPTND